MKDFITTIASVFLLMIFVMQFAAGQVTSHKILQADMVIASFRDNVKEDGYISRENRQKLQSALMDICGCSEGEILIEADSEAAEPQKHAVLHTYRVCYPLKKLIAAAAVLGIGEDENQVYMEQKGWMMSRHEEPDYNHGDTESDDHGDTV